ncbi:MAG: hypothetical protein ACUVTX_05275 [Bacteroidales bacterium]
MSYSQRIAGEKDRVVSVTTDMGEKWTKNPSSRTVLTEPICMRSLLGDVYISGGREKSILLFSNPNVKKSSRRNIIIKVSFNEGLFWPEEYFLLLDEGTCRGNSCLTTIDENTIGIIYKSSHANLVFESISLQELFEK